MNLSAYRKITEYFRHILKNNSKLISLFGILLFLVNLGRIMFNPFKTKLSSLVESGLLLTTFITIVFTIVIAIVLFSYLNNRKQLDLVYNLPVKRVSLLTLNYILGLSITIIYFLIGWLMNVITAAVGGFLDWGPFITILIGTLVLIFITYNILFFTNINSNNTVDAVILAIGVVVVPIIMYSVYYYFKSQFIISAFNSISNNAIYSVSPLTYYISIISTFTYQFNGNAFILFSNGDLVFTSIMMILFAVVLLLSGFYIYKNSQSDIGDKKNLSTILTFACLLSIQLMILFPIYSTNGLSINFIIYSIFPLLLLSTVFILVVSYFKKSFDNTLRNFGIYFLVGSIVIALFIGIEKVNAFNLMSRPYNLDTITGIYIDNWNDSRFFVGYSNRKYDSSTLPYTPKFEEEENIKLIYNYNTELIELMYKNKEENNRYEYNSYPFEYIESNTDYIDYYPYYYEYYWNIYYTNSFNSTKAAYYSIPSKWVYDVIKLYNTHSIVAEDLNIYLENTPGSIKVSYRNLFDSTTYNSNLDYKTFINVYMNELSTINAENIDATSIGHVYVGTVPFLITSNMNNTLNLLKENNINFSSVDVKQDTYLLLPSNYLYSHVSLDRLVNYDNASLNYYPAEGIEHIKLSPELFGEIKDYLISSAVYTDSTYSILLQDGTSLLVNPKYISNVNELIVKHNLKSSSLPISSMFGGKSYD